RSMAGTIRCRVRLGCRLLRPAKLDQRSEQALGVQARHFRAVGAGAWLLVDRSDSGASGPCQRSLHVGNLEADVMDAGAVLFEEAGHGVLGRAWLEQLDRD